MFAYFYIPRLSNDMKIDVQKNHLASQILYRSLDPSKKTASKQKFRIHFIGWNKNHDKDFAFDSDEIRPLTPPGGENNFIIGDLVITAYYDNVKYPAEIIKVNENNTYNVKDRYKFSSWIFTLISHCDFFILNFHFFLFFKLEFSFFSFSLFYFCST